MTTSLPRADYTCCPDAYHRALKLDGARFAQLRLIGVQHAEQYEDEPAEDLEVRDCDRCENTLARVVRVYALVVPAADLELVGPSDVQPRPYHELI